MTTALETIAAAFRESNLTAAGQSPTTSQQTEALSLLNGILAASLGSEVGEELRDINIGGEFDQSACITDYVPANLRLVLNIAGAETLKLHPQPYEGQRLAFVDVAGNLATNNLVLDGNGRKIEDAATLTLNINGDARQWLYRADTGNWTRLTGIEGSDSLPFPSEFDDYFAILLAMRLNPRHGRELSGSSAVWLARMEAQLEARYRKPRPDPDIPSPALLGRHEGTYGSDAAWERGR